MALRTQEQADFAAAQTARFPLAASPDWQDVNVTLPADGTVIHVRLHLPQGGTADIAHIALRSADGKATTHWQFSAKQ